MNHSKKSISEKLATKSESTPKVVQVYSQRNRPSIQNHPGGGELHTIPNQGAPIKTILERFTRGQSIPGETGDYTSYDLSELLKMDKLEKTEYLYNLRLQNKEKAFELEAELQQTPPLEEEPSQALGEKTISEKSPESKT